MADYWATIEIDAFQLANNGLAIEFSPFLRDRWQKSAFES